MNRLPILAVTRRGVRIAVAAATAVAMAGCSVTEVDIPDLYGPSAQAESLILFANPDTILADGSSSSVVQGVLRDKNGQPIRGRAINFYIADEDGNRANIGQLSNDSGKANVITDANGIATVIYTAPVRTDATANQTVTIHGRVISNDANGDESQYVRIQLISPSPRLFPQVPGNAPPNCNFLWEAPNGFRAPAAVLFQTTSSDDDGTIVRYEWVFSDDAAGRPEYSPDTGHIFRTPGTYTVTHTVTDDDGGQAACLARFTIT